MKAAFVYAGSRGLVVPAEDAPALRDAIGLVLAESVATVLPSPER